MTEPSPVQINVNFRILRYTIEAAVLGVAVSLINRLLGLEIPFAQVYATLFGLSLVRDGYAVWQRVEDLHSKLDALPKELLPPGPCRFEAQGPPVILPDGRPSHLPRGGYAGRK